MSTTALYAASVGDGLCLSIGLGLSAALVDCGTTQDPVLAFGGLARSLAHMKPPEAFVFTHLHSDHYNGLVYASERSPRLPLDVRDVYYPVIPQMPGRERLALAFLTMAIGTLGDESGVMEYDLISVMRKLNCGSFTAHPVFAGRSITIGGETLDVLWPPFATNAKGVPKCVRDALRDFEDALEQDKQTAGIYKMAQDEDRRWQPYLNTQEYKIPDQRTASRTAEHSVADSESDVPPPSGSTPGGRQG